MSDTNYKVGGVFTFQHVRGGKVIDEWTSNNIIVNQGLNYILDAALSGGAVTTPIGTDLPNPPVEHSP